MLALIAALAVAWAAPAALPGAKNLTVYRITPRNYTGLTDMDTGDVGGDAFFGLYELGYPLLCPDGADGQGYMPLCRNAPILDIPGFNVYTSFTLEADVRTGRYAECNPDGSTGVFNCTHLFWDYDRWRCWWSNPQWRRDFWGVCELRKCDWCARPAVRRSSQRRLPTRVRLRPRVNASTRPRVHVSTVRVSTCQSRGRVVRAWRQLDHRPVGRQLAIEREPPAHVWRATHPV